MIMTALRADAHPVDVLGGDRPGGVGSGEEHTHPRQGRVRPLRHKHLGLPAAPHQRRGRGYGHTQTH